MNGNIVGAMAVSALVGLAGCAAKEMVVVDESVGVCPEMKPLVSSAPRYPVDALMAGEGGSVDIRFDVAPDGNTSNQAVVTVTAGRTFNVAALDAISDWRFPESEHGCRGATYTINFEVEQGTNWPPKAQ